MAVGLFVTVIALWAGALAGAADQATPTPQSADSSAATVAALGTTSPASAGYISATQAAQTVAQASPSAVAPPQPASSAPSASLTQSVDPGVNSAGRSYEATAAVHTTISKNAAAGITLAAGAATLSITPQHISATATQGASVDGGGAVVFGDTATNADGRPTSDTVVRPSTTGVETFTSIRSADAPTHYSYTLGLTRGEHLQETADGGVAVVAAATVPATQNNLDALKAAGQAPASAGLADPTAAAKLTDALNGAGTPSDVSPNDRPPVDPSQLPAPTATSQAGQQSGATSGESASPGQVSQAMSRINADAQAVAASDISAGTGTNQGQQTNAQRADQAAAQANQSNATADQAKIAPGQAVVAEIAPPTSVDASGQSVPTTLDASGNTVTMTVATSNKDAYPVVADPAVTLEKLVPVFQTQTQYVQYEPYWALAGVLGSSWIYSHSVRAQLYDASGTLTSWWEFWAPEINDWVVMQDTGGNNGALVYLYAVAPVFAQYPVLDHYDFVPATDQLDLGVISVTETAMATSDYALLGDSLASVTTDALTMSPAAYAARVPHCKLASISGDFYDPNWGHSTGQFEFRFCHNVAKHLAAWDGGKPILNSQNPVSDQVFGTYTDNNNGNNYQLIQRPWNGYNLGTVNGHSWYKLLQRDPAFVFPDITLDTYCMNLHAHYDGTVYEHQYSTGCNGSDPNYT